MEATEQSTTRDALRECEEVLANMEAIANVGHWRYEFESGARRWSDQLFRILGLEPGSEPPSPALYRSLVHEDDRERLDDFFQEARTDLGSASNIPHRVVHRGGAIRYVRMQARPWEREGRIVGRIGVSARDAGAIPVVAGNGRR